MGYSKPIQPRRLNLPSFYIPKPKPPTKAKPTEAEPTEAEPTEAEPTEAEDLSAEMQKVVAVLQEHAATKPRRRTRQSKTG